MFSSIIIFVVILSILVLVHELGHFLAAKRAGVWVEEFGFGIPPRIVGKKVGETIYSINLFPFGGFVRLHGELGDRKVKKPKRAFVNLDNKSKIKIVTAGVVMNFLLAVVAFSVVYSATGIPKDTQNVSVVEVAQGSPAENAGINDGDIIREVEGESVTSTQGFIDVVDSLKGDEILIALEREGESELVRVGITPRESPPEGEGPLGVAITTVETYFPPIWQRPFVGVYYGFQEALYWGWAVIAGIVSMLGNLLSGQVPKDIAGPVGIYA
ncbi:MAG: M50 family metallopeptidase, partial [Candidatus Woesebacteria bacterium]